MKKGYSISTLGTLLLVLLLCSCSSAHQQMTTEPSPQNTYESREKALESLVKAVEKKTVFVARYNPPLCPCPEFEVLVEKTWVRVVLIYSEEDEELARAMKVKADKKTKRTKDHVFYLYGSLEAIRFQRTVTGFPVMEFELSSFETGAPSQELLDEEL
jgi:hypothetical protein